MAKKKRKSGLSANKSNPITHYASFLMSMPILVIGAVSVFLLLASFVGIMHFETLRGLSANNLTPAISTISSPFRAVGSFFSNATGFNEMRAELEQVKRENARLNEWFHTAQLLKAENQSMRALLNVNLDGEQSFLTTRLLVDPKSPYVKSAIIAAGQKDGIVSGQAVIGENGLIGRVVGVFDKTARILMITDINSRVPAVIEGTTQKAILGGTNDDVLQLDYVPESITVEKGMKIMSSGDGKLIPSGLAIGEITDITEKKITVVPYASYEQSQYVRILKLSKADESRIQSAGVMTEKTEIIDDEEGAER